MINLYDIIHYGKYYPENERRIPYWWFSTIEKKPVSCDDLLGFYGFSVESLAEQDTYIPFFQVNVIDVEKEFITKYLGKKSNRFHKANEMEDYDRNFKIFIENNHLEERWSRFLEERLCIAAKKWCKDYHIAYK